MQQATRNVTEKKEGNSDKGAVNEKSQAEASKILSSDLSKSIGKNLKLNYEIDKELIGGIKLQLGSLMIDTSMKTKLKKLKTNMIES